jgi:hypothetical protein
MNKRPKSREETPKEGSDSARRYRTATICDRAAQNARAFELFSVQNATPRAGGTKKSQLQVLLFYFKWLRKKSAFRASPATAYLTMLSIS